MTTLSIEDLKAWLELLPKVTPGPWGWNVIDASMASLGVLPDPGFSDPHVLSVSPCKSCQGDEWEWGKCLTPSEADATHLAKCDPATIAALIEGYIALAEAKPKVSVKPLEWCQSEDGTEWYSTDDPSNNGRGTYWIHPSKLNDGEFELRIVEQRDGSYLDTEAAKAAAQADYEARILSALNIGGTND